MNILTAGKVFPVIVLLTVSTVLVYETAPLTGDEAVEVAGATYDRPVGEPEPAPLIRNVLIISETTVQKQSDGSVVVRGQATNADNTTRSASLEAILYDEAGNAVGRAEGLIQDVPAGGTTEFVLLSTTAVDNFSDYSVALDRILNPYAEESS